MMQRILKGDTSGQIALALADGYNYAGCVVEFRYQGAVRTFRNCEEGQTIQFNFTAAETAVMALGAFPVTVRLFTPDGQFFTVNNADVKIEVTDCIADVREGGVIVVEATSGLYGVDDLPERYTTKDIREKINEIIQRLGGGVAALCIAACVACGSLFGAGVTVQKSNLEDIHNDEKVVTGVTFDASGLATKADLEQAAAKKDGAARILPKYLWCRDFFDSYADDAAWYYAMADMGGACSSVRDGNAYSRNFDFPYDERAEFVVRMAAGPDRFASVGVANVGTNLTEGIVTSGKPSRFFKCLPGATVDGINERGVAANINVVPANGAEGTVWPGHEINALGAVRWVLDRATSAGMAASNLAAKVYIPDALIRKGYSAHFMVADERETWIVEDGAAHKADGRAVLTNYRLYAPDDPFGTGFERYAILADGGNITSAWFRAAYRRPFTRPTEFAAPGVGTHTETDALAAWADANIPQGAPESLTRNGKSWQTVHCSVYDLSNRVLRVAVQETPDWYVFGIPASGSGKVLSVNGKEGEVVLSAADVNALPDTYTPPAAPVQSVNGKTGAVTLGAGDVGALPANGTNGFRRVDDMAVYTNGFRWTCRDLPQGFSFAEEQPAFWQHTEIDDAWDVIWRLSRQGYEIPFFASGIVDDPFADSPEWYAAPTIEGTGLSVTIQKESVILPATDRLATTGGVNAAINNAGHVTASDLAPINAKVEQSLVYSSGVYQYMAGNTNAWFSGTNYVTTADGTTRTQFAWEDGMDAATVPCSMSLWEIRNGQKAVWDQRDWTVWYWNFKAGQLSNNLANAIGNLSEYVRTNAMTRGWAKYTAVRGLDNPDPSTLWIDTPKVQLMAGHQWEKIVEAGGAGYWTITGNGIELSQQDAESTFLTIKDFEGNACLTFRKTASYLVYCECGTDIVSNYWDAQNRVVFHLTTDVQPTAEFSTTLELDSFVEQDDDGCPSDCEWTGSAGNWDCHFILKPGITAQSCFARFKVLREGENVVEHTVPIKINGGIAFEQDGVTRKIRPTISGNTVNWVVVQ